MAKSQELVSVQSKKENLVAQISSEQNEMFKMLDQMEAEARALNSEIKRLQAEAAARAAKNGTSTKAPGAYTWPLHHI